MSFITLPSAFPVVGLPIVGAFMLNAFQQTTVTRLRKEAGVAYPNAYASDAEALKDIKKMKFNCAQRAHANTIENIPYVFALFAFFSVFHPKVASASMLIWIAGRVSYTIGYVSGDPKKRVGPAYFASYLGLATLFFGSAYIAVQKTYQNYV
ncbi:hypothetical protein CI109_106853 [Kwoniella shandongensis]|uniref:Uncharacterized protein n=1 Tax=Kwoniella shandongensis TaxID=1734106 RepID=A0A5M6C762_9TREE|nr:uncharacterized protein CI109_000891 [Kwoniella shandongensis]KAA5530711.1 hypothetical protein CI109_000891 [Kwoniella shandongensis]